MRRWRDCYRPKVVNSAYCVAVDIGLRIRVGVVRSGMDSGSGILLEISNDSYCF